MGGRVLGCWGAASSVELWAAEEGAELGTFHPRAQETHPSPQSSRGQRKAITSLVFVAAQRVGAGRECHLSKRRPGWELWQKGHSEAGERPREEWGPPRVQKGWHGWVGMVWCPRPLPGPMGEAEPPEGL